jgi:tetratricopeptide (TPR) repeat protein
MTGVSAGGNINVGNSIQGDYVAGDQFTGDKVMGDKYHTEINNVFNNDQDENVESYDKLSQFERLKKAINYTMIGHRSFSTDKKKALDLFYKAQSCYPKLPEPYEFAGNILQKLESYEEAVEMFNKAKKYYNDVRSIYSGIDPGDLRKEEFDLEERINSINDNIKRVDTSISYLNGIMNKHILLQKLFNRFGS